MPRYTAATKAAIAAAPKAATAVPFNTISEVPRFIPVPEWNRYHLWPKLPSLRWMIFQAHENGLAPALRKINNRVLVNEKMFWEWVDSHAYDTPGSTGHSRDTEEVA